MCILCIVVDCRFRMVLYHVLSLDSIQESELIPNTILVICLQRTEEIAFVRRVATGNKVDAKKALTLNCLNGYLCVISSN